MNHYNSERGPYERDPTEEDPTERDQTEGGPSEEDSSEGDQHDIHLSEVATGCVELCVESLRHIDARPFCHSLCLWEEMGCCWRKAYFPKWLQVVKDLDTLHIGGGGDWATYSNRKLS